MDNVIIKRDSRFVAAIQASAKMDASTLGSSDQAAELLSDADQLSQLCTICFWASLEMEERREVRGTLSFCSPSPSLLARTFATPVPVTVQNLVALLTASPLTPLAVQGGADGLVIWGVLDSEPKDLLQLRIAGYGILLASRSRRVLALLHRGAVSIPVAADVDSLMQLIGRTLGKERSLEERDKVSARLIRIATAMIRHGHGGILVLVPPEGSSWRESVDFRFRFDETSAGLLRDSSRNFEILISEGWHDFDDVATGRKSPDSLFALRDQYNAMNVLRALNESLLRRVADLSLIDGAVVMDFNLCLLGFGAKLLFGPETFAVTTLNAVTGAMREDVPLSELGGTRHQSSARFVHGNRATDVFVVSQDGRLSLFSWSEHMQSVAAIQNLEHFIWEYRAS